MIDNYKTDKDGIIPQIVKHPFAYGSDLNNDYPLPPKCKFVSDINSQQVDAYANILTGFFIKNKK